MKLLGISTLSRGYYFLYVGSVGSVGSLIKISLDNLSRGINGIF